jgi:hypothetical protein
MSSYKQAAGMNSSRRLQRTLLKFDRYMLIVLVVFLIQIPDWIGKYFPGLLIPNFGYHFPLFVPVAGIVWLMNKLKRRQDEASKFLMPNFNFLILSTILIWFLGEVARSVLHGTEINPRLVLDMGFIYLGFCVLVSFGVSCGRRRFVLRRFMLTCLFFASLHLIISQFHVDDMQINVSYINLSELRNNNELAYLMVFVMALAIFERPALFGKWTVLFVVIPLVLVIALVEGSRGAMVILVMMLGLYIGRLAFVTGLRFVFIGLVMALVAIVANYHELIGGLVQPTITGFQIEYVSYEESTGSLGGDAASTYTRYRTLLEGFYRWSENQIFGIGLNEVEAIRILDLGIHSVLIVPLYAYGIIGTVPYIAFWMYVVIQGWMSRGADAICYIVCLSAIMLIMADFKSWMSFVFYAILAGLKSNTTNVFSRNFATN